MRCLSVGQQIRFSWAETKLTHVLLVEGIDQVAAQHSANGPATDAKAIDAQKVKLARGCGVCLVPGSAVGHALQTIDAAHAGISRSRFLAMYVQLITWFW